MVLEQHPTVINRRVPQVVYGEDAMIPIALSERSWRVETFNEEESAVNMQASLDMLPEAQHMAHMMEVVV